MSNIQSKFQKYLQDVINEGKNHIEKNNWCLPGSDIPDVTKIEELLQPFLGSQEYPPPRALKTAVSLGPNMGAAYETLGNLEPSQAWYHLGRYIWRGGEQFESTPPGFPHYGSRMTVGMLQMDAAICADRAGQTSTAKQLFTWVVKNRSFSEKELREFEGTNQPKAVWEWKIQKAYAKLCLGDLQSANETAEEALLWIGKDRETKLDSATKMPLLIFPTILALIRYELDPTPNKCTEAVRLLDYGAVSTTIHVDRLEAFFYLFNLRAKYPDLIEFHEEDLPPSIRAIQAADACRDWATKVGIKLDNSVESLHILDKNLQKIYSNIPDEDQQKLVLFMLGSYFGEIARSELEGGEWNFSAETMLSWTVDWDLEEAEIQLWPFQRVHEFATSKIDDTLTDLWKQTKQAYLNFEIAASENE